LRIRPVGLFIGYNDPFKTHNKKGNKEVKVFGGKKMRE
jgi:hypothetical protein